MPYTHIRYIGYQISTVADRPAGANRTDVKYGIAPGTINNPPDLYAPDKNLNGISNDAKVRIQRLVAVMLKAAQAISAIDRDTVLKVFVAPEFYFRPDNAEVSYSMDDYRHIKEVLRVTLASYEEFKHWLIIPGTIMWKQDVDDTGKSSRIVNPFHDVYFNTSMYYKQGDNPFIPKSKVIEKHTASQIDGIPTGRHNRGVNARPNDPTKKSAPEEYPQYQSSAKIQKHLFTMNGLKFGLEICLEHAYSATAANDFRVIKKYLAGNGASPYATGVDVHILTAGGMTINSRSVVAKRNGFIVRTDGYVNPNNPATQIGKVLGYIGGMKPSQLNTNTQLRDLSKPWYKSISIPDTDNLYLAPPAGFEASWNSQKINIASSYKLP